ncbi:hypothetical protein [Streptomyces radiopugnans]|uniref:Integral membrane protein n=1 Tax=Streptomyces radiopugnans TaxID=403935 RepID=A0A1H9HK97_9ACTN|nr:hypothetical protein [Streptomyces radiopugnans]SEQ62723.1 hypothetical protein SAMN05216481_111113 [Streptomyces radiopugnans]
MNVPPYPHRPADPVRSLLHRHRELCARAVDPLEIAAALEAHGITDRTAARYRHRDVFSLSEELYARTPRADGAGEVHGADGTGGADGARAEGPRDEAPGARALRHGRGAGRARSAGAALLPLLPGGLCAAAPAAYALTEGLPAPARTAAGAAGALLVLLSVRLCLRGTALSGTAVLGGCLLAGHALAGGRPLAWALDGRVPVVDVLPGEWCVPLGLALAVAPAVWCARWFAARARPRLGDSRSLEEFAARTRPLLAAAVALFAVTLLAVLAVAHALVDGGLTGGPSGGVIDGVIDGVIGGAAGPEGARIAEAAALGTLLFTALLLSAHGFPAAAAGGVVAACALEAAALAAAAASGHTRLAFPGRPVEALATAWGPAAVPAAACACAALALSAVAASRLTGASAHHREEP